MDVESAKRFAALTLKKRELKALLSDLEKDLTILEEDILNAYALEGVCKLTVDTEEGPYNVGVRQEVWAGAMDGDYDAACDGLVAAGLSEFVQRRFNVQTVSAFIRELKAAGKDLPPELVGKIKVSERDRLSLTKAGSKARKATGNGKKAKADPADLEQFYS